MITIPGVIPVVISPFFWLTSLLISFLMSMPFEFGTALWASSMAVWMVVIFFSILIHELGHALTALAFGQRSHIQFGGMGGLTVRQGGRLGLGKEFIIVLFGPLAGLSLAGACYLIAQEIPPKQDLIRYLFDVAWTANVFWAIVNLVPVLPLDGGHLLRIILESIFGFWGVKIALILGFLISISIGGWAFSQSYFVLGVLFFIFAFDSLGAFQRIFPMDEQDRDPMVVDLFREAEEDLRAGRTDAAMLKFKALQDKLRGTGVLAVVTQQRIAEILSSQGRLQEAYSLLLTVRNSLEPDTLPLFQHLAFVNQDYEEALGAGIKAFRAYQTREIALVNAMAAAALRDGKSVVGWLDWLKRDGEDVKRLLQKSEFDPIRSNSSFRAFEETL